MKCERCGGPAPVEGETYRHYWPCGCAVVPDKIFEAPSLRNNGERVWYARGLGTTQTHPMREGAIAAWRAALGPYRAPRVDTDQRPPPSAGHYALLLWERRQREHQSSRKPNITVNLTPPTLPTPSEISRAVRDAEARGDRYLDGPPLSHDDVLSHARAMAQRVASWPEWKRRDLAFFDGVSRHDPRPHQAHTAEIMSTVGCPCGVCGTWAVVCRDPASATSRGTCTCGTDWVAWDKQTSAQRRRRLGL